MPAVGSRVTRDTLASCSLRSHGAGDTVSRMRTTLLIAAVVLAAASSGCARGARGAEVGPATGAPDSFLRLAPEAQTSQTIDVREGLARAAAWRGLTDFLAERHTIAVRDQTAGFAMTAWEASLTRDGVPDLRYRTRLVATYVGDWRQLHVRAEASWKEGDEWQFGVDRTLLASTIAELRTRVGVR